MEENLDTIKITYAKNLNKLNFSSLISVPINSNVNVKTILNVDSYIFDEKVECGNGKAIITGKLGVKVLYIDTDNISNIVNDSQSFSETFVDESITSDCFINISNASVVGNVLSSDKTLKINCDVNISPTLYLNLALNTSNSSFENMIVKKNEISTNTIACNVDTSFEYATNIETKDNVTKILCYDAYFTPSSLTSYDEYAVVEGKLYSKLLYESASDDESVIKEICDTFNLKSEINIPNITKDCLTDFNFSMDKSKENISTEIEDGNNIITISHNIKVNGVCIKSVSIDLIDDMYSVDNEIEISTSKRDYTKNMQTEFVTDNISGEITLDDNETAIDDIISNININAEITNHYLKDNNLYLEGIISSHIIYIDENKEIKHKPIDLPFVINTKIKIDQLDCIHSCINILDNKIKVKRGTVIELDYSVSIMINIYQKDSKEIIDNMVIGKPLDYSTVDYQIFIAKPNESVWDLCKRIKISPDDISKYNKNLPLIMEGGEKIVIKR
ncbi:MAG TPA: DUF3794 domain-containing protein [Candidatus Onthoplasma faecigallinarum]|nr:DUF3794 domain-containing protein [Candidatus Onthoplasma faecigallinarum]